MAIGQQPTDLTNTHREIDRISATPAAGTSPERGVQQHHRRASTPPSIALTGAYHGEGRAIEKCTQKGKYAPKPRKIAVSAAMERGTKSPTPAHTQRVRPSNRLDFRETKSPSKRASDAPDPGATGATWWVRAADSHRAGGEDPDEQAKTQRTRVITTKGYHPAGQSSHPPKSQHPMKVIPPKRSSMAACYVRGSPTKTPGSER
jgi:hypothetical protein